MDHQSHNIEKGSFKDVFFNLELVQAHYSELVKLKEIFVVNGDYDKYNDLEKSGRLFTLRAFKNKMPVGYSINILETHLHYKDVLVCYNDLLFIHPEYRATPLGLKLIRETEKQAKESGAEVMLWHAKPNTPLDKILPRLGNRLHENIYLKEL